MSTISMIDRLAPAVVARGPALASVLLIVSVIFLASRFFGSREDSDTPLVGEEYGNPEKRRTAYVQNARDLYMKGYQKFKERAFRLTTLDGMARRPPPRRPRLSHCSDKSQVPNTWCRETL